jgi:hypothetical protein
MQKTNDMHASQKEGNENEKMQRTKGEAAACLHVSKHKNWMGVPT